MDIKMMVERILHPHNVAWYHSNEARLEYEELKTVGDKIVFFMEFFREMNPYLDNRAVHALGVLFADGIASSNQEYAAYPMIIDEHKNPFLKGIMPILKLDLKRNSVASSANLEIRNALLKVANEIDGIDSNAEDYLFLKNENDSSYLYLIRKEIMTMFEDDYYHKKTHNVLKNYYEAKKNYDEIEHLEVL